MRPLNRDENIVLLSYKERPDIIGVDYERIVPRATLCTIYIKNKFLLIPLNPIVIHGVAIRSKADKEDYKIGQKWAFKRAIELYLKRKEE